MYEAASADPRTASDIPAVKKRLQTQKIMKRHQDPQTGGGAVVGVERGSVPLDPTFSYYRHHNGLVD